METQLQELIGRYGYAEVLRLLKSIGQKQPQQKIVLNSCFGGYGFSQEAIDWLRNHGMENLNDIREVENNRIHPLMVQCVETLGSEKASGEYASLRIAEYPQGVDIYIEDYDGVEDIHW